MIISLSFENLDSIFRQPSNRCGGKKKGAEMVVIFRGQGK